MLNYKLIKCKRYVLICRKKTEELTRIYHNKLHMDKYMNKCTQEI